jgi:hypothetical protein
VSVSVSAPGLAISVTVVRRPHALLKISAHFCETMRLHDACFASSSYHISTSASASASSYIKTHRLCTEAGSAAEGAKAFSLCAENDEAVDVGVVAEFGLELTFALVPFRVIAGELA